MSPMDVIDLKPKEFIDLDPADFVKRFEQDRERFSSFRIMPPKLGSSGFGKIRANLKVPIYGVETANEQKR